MRYLWVDQGNNPWWEAITANGIDGLFFDPRDERVKKGYLEEVQAKLKGAVGIYFGHGWSELGHEPEQYVKEASKYLGPLRKDNNFPKVQINIEYHEPEFIMEVFRLWRVVYPWHATSWSLEPMQGGWMSSSFVVSLIKNKIRVSPQLFGSGDMVEYAADRVMRDLVKRGFPIDLISSTYDASKLHLWWDGFAFTQGRLPQP